MPVVAAAPQPSLNDSLLPPLSTEPPVWMERSNLVFNSAARELLHPIRTTAAAPVTLHFTFGSIVMLDFVHNWIYFVRRAQLKPALIGAADVSLLQQCDKENLAAVGVAHDLAEAAGGGEA